MTTTTAQKVTTNYNEVANRVDDLFNLKTAHTMHFGRGDNKWLLIYVRPPYYVYWRDSKTPITKPCVIFEAARHEVYTKWARDLEKTYKERGYMCHLVEGTCNANIFGGTTECVRLWIWGNVAAAPTQNLPTDRASDI